MMCGSVHGITSNLCKIRLIMVESICVNFIFEFIRLYCAILFYWFPLPPSSVDLKTSRPNNYSLIIVHAELGLLMLICQLVV